ncbi:MAG: hypothetical protein COA57_04460 [Flavobacteriales bacterium]|nr:MAG: hypothetical protein COA57_04460 [Flavobacteriales bacterium]
MKTLDAFSKRFLAVTLGTSLVLASLGFFVLSVNGAIAGPKTPKNSLMPLSESGADIYPFGIHDDTFYWLEYNSNGWHFRTKAKADWN